MLQDNIMRVQSIDDIFFFFDKRLRELRLHLTTVNLEPGVAISYEGSVLDMFLRRCIFSFVQMMFEDL